MSKRLLIATSNNGKMREIQAILSPLKLEIVTPQSLQLSIEVKETGNSYAENAHIKAKAYLKASDLPVLADDSGLEVDALNGAPGLKSARYSPKENADDMDRRLLLLRKLQGHPQPWRAHFHCTAVLLTPEGEHLETTGQCAGVIIPQMRGSGGFGYDPIFYLPEYDLTMAELPPELKNSLSHRARALSAMIPDLPTLLAF